MQAHGLDAADKATRARVHHSVGNALFKFARRKQVTAGDLRKGVRVWQLE